METSCYRLHLIVADPCDLNILIIHYYKSCVSLEYCYFHILQYLWCLVQLNMHMDLNKIMLHDWTSNWLSKYTWFIKIPMHFVRFCFVFQLLQVQGSSQSSSKLKSKSWQKVEVPRSIQQQSLALNKWNRTICWLISDPVNWQMSVLLVPVNIFDQERASSTEGQLHAL